LGLNRAQKQLFRPLQVQLSLGLFGRFRLWWERPLFFSDFGRFANVLDIKTGMGLLLGKGILLNLELKFVTGAKLDLSGKSWYFV